MIHKDLKILPKSCKIATRTDNFGQFRAMHWLNLVAGTHNMWNILREVSRGYARSKFPSAEKVLEGC